MAPPSGISGLDAASLAIRRARLASRIPSGATGFVDRTRWITLRFFTDLVVLYASAGAALFADSAVRNSSTDRAIAGAFPLVVLAISRSRRGWEERLKGSLLDSAAQVLGVVSLAAMLAIGVESVFGGAHPLALALRLWLFSVVYLGLARSVLLCLRRRLLQRPQYSTPTLVVGAGMIGVHLVNRLANEPSYGLRPVGFLDSDPLPSRDPQSSAISVPVLGGPSDLLAAIAATNARHVMLAFSAEADHLLVSKVRECQRLGIDVSLVPRMYEAINERTTLDHVGGLPVLVLRAIDPRGWQFAFKHAIDRGVAGLCLLLAAPLMLLIAAAVRGSSPGPVLFRQRRVGRDEHEFDVLKFRTMRDLTEIDLGFELESGLAPGGVEGTDRRTRIGRVLRDTSLDELPQLLNVVRGDMSLVGPRPERPEFVAVFARDVARYEERHRVKSGITGWAQVHGLRGQTSIADRVEWDNYYIQNWSLRLDLRILVLTVVELLRFRS